jgi:hydrogenase maturation protease
VAPAQAVVVGIGEPFRQDDGCGPRVVRALRGHVAPAVRLVEQVGDMTELLDVWEAAPLAVVVDAMRSGAGPGEVARLEGEELLRARPERTTSSHGLSVRDAFELGRALGRLPIRLVVYLIEADRVAPGTALTPAVAEAVRRTATAIVAELEGIARPSAGAR